MCVYVATIDKDGVAVGLVGAVEAGFHRFPHGLAAILGLETEQAAGGAGADGFFPLQCDG